MTEVGVVDEVGRLTVLGRIGEEVGRSIWRRLDICRRWVEVFGGGSIFVGGGSVRAVV
jgi:hypothetical protein